MFLEFANCSLANWRGEPIVMPKLASINVTIAKKFGGKRLS
jgi:hypothetical protein